MLVGILAMPLVLVLVPVSDNFPSPLYQWLDRIVSKITPYTISSYTVTQRNSY